MTAGRAILITTAGSGNIIYLGKYKCMREPMLQMLLQLVPISYRLAFQDRRSLPREFIIEKVRIKFRFLTNIFEF